MKRWVSSIFILVFNLSIALMFLKEANFLKISGGKVVAVT